MPTVTLTFGAGDSKILPGGNFLMVKDSSADVTIELRKGGVKLEDSDSGIPAGWSVTPERPPRGLAFDSAKVTSATAQSVTFYYSQGSARVDRITGSVDVSKATTLTSAADVSVPKTATATVLIASSSATREVLISNKSTADTLYVGDSSVTDTQGIPVGPGLQITLSTTAAIYGYVPTSAGAAVTAGLLSTAD